MALRQQHNVLAPLYDCKRLFVQRYAARTIKADAAQAFDGNALMAEIALPAVVFLGIWFALQLFGGFF